MKGWDLLQRVVFGHVFMIPSQSKWTTGCSCLSDICLAMYFHGLLQRCEIVANGKIPVRAAASTRISYDAGEMAAWSAERKAWARRAAELLHRPLTPALVLGFLGVASCVMKMHC